MNDLIHYDNPEALLSMPRAEAERALNQLELSDQLSLILMAPWEKRQELLLLSQRARELVQAMPAEELFWTIKAIGPEDTLQILALATPEQLQFMLDLDWWQKDRLRPEKIIAWLVLMFEADEHLVTAWAKWIFKKDEWLIPALLLPFIKVYKRPDDMDIQEARDTLPAFTLEDVYYVAFKKDEIVPLFSRFLMKLVEASPGIHRDTMECILQKTKAEITETAYRLRQSRLSDHGLLDYYDSLDIYAPLPRNQVRRVKLDPSRWPVDALALPFVPTLYMGEYPTIMSAVQALAGTASLARVLQEWIGAANKVLMADLVDLDDPDALRKALLKVAALLNLALEVESKASKDNPENILAVSVVEDLIRLANRVIRDLSHKARKLVESGLLPEKFLYLPERWAETLEGLTRVHPMFFDEKTGDFRWISSTLEVHDLNELLERIRNWARLMKELPPHWSKWKEAFPWNATNLTNPVELFWPKALLTALAQKSLGYGLAVSPIPQEKLQTLRQEWFTRDGEPKETGELCSYLIPLVHQAQVPEDFLMEEIPPLLRALGSELQDVPWDEEIDGRFITQLLVLIPQGEG